MAFHKKLARKISRTVSERKFEESKHLADQSAHVMSFKLRRM